VVLPATIETVVGATVNDVIAFTTGAAMTVTPIVADEVWPADVAIAVMIAVPGATAVIFPFASTVATVEVAEAKATVPVKPGASAKLYEAWTT
jgi:hypothetical protein